MPVVNSGSMVQAGEAISDLPSVGEPLQEDHSPIREKTSPSYADITKKKLDDNSCSSDDGSIKQLSKKVGRKSKKEARGDEAARLKMQGSQSTIEMSFGRSKRTRLPKGVINPSSSGK